MPEATTHEPVSNNEAFDFVQNLARELNAGKVELPSFPEVALRVQRALGRDEVNDEDVLRAVGAEPALAMRVLQMANSTALNPLGKPVVELRSAILRVGHSMVRAAAMAFVMQQLRSAEGLRHLRGQLNQLWQRSVSVGSLSMVVARHAATVNPDSGLLAGVLHGVGKLYILTRATRHPRLIADAETFAQIVRDWHAGIARALLENWELPEELLLAVQEYEDLEREMRGPIALVDVLAAGNLLATVVEQKDGAASDAQLNEMLERSSRVWQRLRLDQAGCRTLLTAASTDLATLRQLLG